MRPIDADKLKDLIHSKSNSPEDLWDTMGVLNAINNMPTIEPETKVVANVTFNKEQLEEIVEKAKADILAQIERPQGEWIVTAEDNDGVHRICCPFCSYEKGSNNTDPIVVTFTNFPKFCENCGAQLGGERQ